MTSSAFGTTKSRLSYIDNLRTLLTILVILLHLSIGYGAAGDWYYDEGDPAMLSVVLLTIFTAVNQAFFMGFFFMISSYLTPSSFDRKGAMAYLRDRLKRLGIPMLFYALVINPFLIYTLRAFGGARDSLGEFLSQKWLQASGFGPMWFVETLLIFSIGYVLVRSVTRTTPAQNSSPVPSNAMIAVFAFVLGIVTFVVRIWFPVGWWFEPLHLQLAHFPQYLALFIIGIIAFHRNWFESLRDAQSKLWRWIALVLVPVFPALAILGGALDGDITAFEGGWHWQSFAYAVWEQFIGIALIIALLVWFRQRFNQQGRLARAMSNAAYAAYIFHAPVIVWLAMALSGIQLDGGLKFILVAPIAVGASFIVGYCIKQLPFARDIL